MGLATWKKGGTVPLESIKGSAVWFSPCRILLRGDSNEALHNARSCRRFMDVHLQRIRKFDVILVVQRGAAGGQRLTRFSQRYGQAFMDCFLIGIRSLGVLRA